MNAKNARLIRIGIMSRCIPYKKQEGTNWKIFDFESYRNYQVDWFFYCDVALVYKAHLRTKEWERVT